MQERCVFTRNETHEHCESVEGVRDSEETLRDNSHECEYTKIDLVNILFGEPQFLKEIVLNMRY